jgi:hypothetical protein
MKRLSKVTLAVAACGLFAAAVGPATSGDKVLICHGTASDTQPWELIEVDAHALNGHFDGTEPGHGGNNHPDFFPTGSDCSGGPGGGEE